MLRKDGVAELIGRYGRLIRSVVARVGGRSDEDLGDEVLQRVSVGLWSQAKSEQNVAYPASYIYRCAVRETLRELARQRQRPSTPGELAACDLDAAVASDDPEGSARAQQLAAVTETCLTDLTPERAAAVRAHLAGFSVEEIMEQHGWPYQKARNLVARGLADLRLRLSERGFDER